ncbi:Lrp/AsnC family transcriptional regulator [Paenactinomyces guangxiensis]|uniref:Lrp/AsnC family transcriptional regulator n=1 Tax=Paenactinomyces guangxiensis TaxID=1490290 RepID=A0A7W1WRF0_9BACL|nr:Lrp/AsnC family transcriptional regulator [Paenactinomyces guangxiensis]MBA4494670.1 Lrp/AsnC family transcriptional regulator [Paenactinomyces guangxiensis]MBH8591754.1 Lrp/AsnC family transcriptional regulator [Paenactinomyces guangxiensis]
MKLEKNCIDSQELSGMDREIALMLQKNARMPFTRIAEILGVSERTIRMRVAQMQESGILSLVGVINPIKVGLNVQTFVLLAAEQHSLEEVVAQLKEMDEVRFVVLITGEYQIFAEVMTRSYEDLSQWIIQKLNKIEGIQKTNVMPVLKKMKSSYNFVK